MNLWVGLVDSVTLDGILYCGYGWRLRRRWRGKGEASEDATRRLAEMRERLIKWR